MPESVPRGVLAAALESTSDAVVVTDRDGVILWVNAAFTALTGYTPSDAIGRNPRILNSGLHPLEFFRAMWETLIAGGTWRGTIENRRKDGTLYLEQQTISPFLGASGAPLYFVAIKREAAGPQVPSCGSRNWPRRWPEAQGG